MRSPSFPATPNAVNPNARLCCADDDSTRQIAAQKPIRQWMVLSKIARGARRQAQPAPPQPHEGDRRQERGEEIEAGDGLEAGGRQRAQGLIHRVPPPVLEKLVMRAPHPGERRD